MARESNGGIEMAVKGGEHSDYVVAVADLAVRAQTARGYLHARFARFIFTRASFLFLLGQKG